VLAAVVEAVPFVEVEPLSRAERACFRIAAPDSVSRPSLDVNGRLAPALEQ